MTFLIDLKKGRKYNAREDNSDFTKRIGGVSFIRSTSSSSFE